MEIFKWAKRKSDRPTSLPDYDAPGDPLARLDSAERALPRFNTTGSDLGPSDAELPRMRMRIRDAFSPSQPIQDPRMFAGREEILKTLIRAIEDMRLHVVVYGDRGIGKTSLLHLLTRLATEAHYHVAYHSCGERDSFSEVFRTIAAQIPLLYDSRYDPTTDETASGASLDRMLPEGDYNVSQLSQAFSYLSNTRLIIVLDEFDRSPGSEFRRTLAEFIKNVSDRSLRVRLVIGGVGSSLAELVEHIPAIRRNILGLEVPAMTPDEVKEVISIGERISGLTYLPQSVDHIVELARGSPYMAAMLAQYSGFRAVDEDLDTVSPWHVVEASRQVALELRGRLSERAVVAVDAALSEGMQPVLKDYAKAAMGSVAKLTPSLSSPSQLAEHSKRYPALIEPVPEDADGRYRFTEEGLPVYLWILLNTP